MSQHKIRLEWEAKPHPKQPGTYSRDHKAIVSQDVTIPVSAAAEYLGNPLGADPEQLLVNAVASCHMLYFLAICEGSGYEVASYVDEASGEVSKSPEGYQWVSTITLHPVAVFASGKQPDGEALKRLHHRAHKGCFIANSVKTAVVIDLN